MSKERELLARVLTSELWSVQEELQAEIKELLAQPEPEPTTDKQTSVSMAVMPNGVSVSNVYDAYEAGRASVMVEPDNTQYLLDQVCRLTAENAMLKGKWNAQAEQEPVAWVSLSDIEWMNIVNNPKILELTNGRHNSEEAVNLAVKMTEEICKKNNSNSIPIPEREPLSDEDIRTIVNQLPTEVDLETGIEFCRIIDKAHGIG